MRPGWRRRVEASYESDLETVTHEVLVQAVDGPPRIVGLDHRAHEAARVAGPAVLDPSWWRATFGARVLEVEGPSVHLFTDRPPDLPTSPLVEQVTPWRLERLRADAGEEAWQRSGLGRDATVFLARFSEPLEPPAWMERATPAARRTVVSAAAALADWDGSPADLSVLTHPAHRRRGHGRDVASAATAQAVREGGLARWRVDAQDVPATALARTLGFEPWGTVLRVHLGS